MPHQSIPVYFFYIFFVPIFGLRHMNTVSCFLFSVLDIFCITNRRKYRKHILYNSRFWILQYELNNTHSASGWNFKKNEWSFFSRFDLPISLCTVCMKNHLELNNWAVLVFAFCHHIFLVPHSLIYCDTMALLLSMYFISMNVFITCSAYTSCHCAEHTHTHIHTIHACINIFNICTMYKCLFIEMLINSTKINISYSKNVYFESNSSDL